MAVSQTNLAWETLLDLSATRSGPLNRRLAEALRSAIRDGRLPRGAAVPPSRVLAVDLNVSRWAVTEAYSQLISEGFLSGKTGSATRVIWTPEPDGRRVRPVHNHPEVPDAKHHGPSRYDLAMCTPDFRHFPRRKWVEAIRTVTDTVPFDRLGYAEPGGERALREVLADHLNRRRGTRVEPGLMTVFTGARHAMAAVCRSLAADGVRRIGVEDPGSCGLWDAARDAGLEVVPLPVDEQGLVVEMLDGQPDLRAVAVGAAHQVITGVTLTPERRAWLLEWARRVDGLVVEDDYDSEFVYDGPALSAMQGSDPRRVALLGSMSRIMTPSVGVGWAVVPRRWLDGARSGQHTTLTTPALNQLALAHFIESGDLDRHLRNSRRRFRERRDALIEALRRRLPGARISGHHAGLHFLLELPEGASSSRVIASAPRKGIELCDLNYDRNVAEPDERHIAVGYANLADPLVDEAAEVLVELIFGTMADA